MTAQRPAIGSAIEEASQKTHLHDALSTSAAPITSPETKDAGCFSVKKVKV